MPLLPADTQPITALVWPQSKHGVAQWQAGSPLDGRAWCRICCWATCCDIARRLGLCLCSACSISNRIIGEGCASVRHHLTVCFMCRACCRTCCWLTCPWGASFGYTVNCGCVLLRLVSLRLLPKSSLTAVPDISGMCRARCRTCCWLTCPWGANCRHAWSHQQCSRLSTLALLLSFTLLSALAWHPLSTTAYESRPNAV